MYMYYIEYVLYYILYTINIYIYICMYVVFIICVYIYTNKSLLAEGIFRHAASCVIRFTGDDLSFCARDMHFQ